jgi:hypothetical protein
MTVYACDECRRSTSGNCGQHGINYGGGQFVLNCPHGLAPSLPCAACGRGFPAPITNVYNAPLTDDDLDRIARRLADLLWPDVHPEKAEG